MLNWIIDFSLRHRLLVVGLAVASAVAGALSLRKLNIDAFPDTTPVQVQINTIAPALGPEEVEQQITFPIEQVISGLPHLQQLRSVSKFGLSQVVVTFDDGTDIYFAHQVITERLNTVKLPLGIKPDLGPVSTGLGEVFHYVVTGKGNDETDTRTIHDWIVKPKMGWVRGAAEINSWGGFEKQYQIRIDPNKLHKHHLRFDEVLLAVENNNRNVGGGNIRWDGRMLLVQGLGRAENADAIRGIVITAKENDPIKIKDVADVEVGSEIRRGAVTADGKGEVVLGLGFMRMGENSHEVTWAMKTRLDEIKTSLASDPKTKNVKVEPVYDRTELVDFVIGTARTNLFEAGLLVIAVLFLFLGNLRAAAIVALAIPLSMLFAFCGMLRFGITASLLSLGAIDFGMIVDSSVVMVENCVRHIAHGDLLRKSKLEMIRDAAVEVRKPTLFGELIIMIVYLPILTLEGIEGKMFRPMALTVIFALAGSMILSMTLMPVLASFMLSTRLPRLVRWFFSPALAYFSTARQALAAVNLLDLSVYVGSVPVVLLFTRIGPAKDVPKDLAVALAVVLTILLLLVQTFRGALADMLPREEDREPLLMRMVKWLYAPVLRYTMQHKFAVLVVAVCLLVGTFVLVAPNLGSEFVPTLSEGAITINVVRLADTPIERSIEENTKIEQAVLAKFPDEVNHIWSRIGTAEIATDPMGVELTDIFISLRPRSQWKKATTQDRLTELIEKELRPFLGSKLTFSQPIKLRLDEMTSGVRADLAVKLFGDDIPTLQAKANEIKKVLDGIAGSADVNIEPLTGLPVLQVKIKQDEIARHGVPAQAVLDLVESLGGKRLGEVVEGQYRFPLVIRLPEKYRGTVKDNDDPKRLIEELLVPTAKGEQLPLVRLAEVKVLEDSPSTITREWGQRRVSVSCNVRGRDLGSFVAEAQRKIGDEVTMPSSRYHVEYGGQFEHLTTARNRLFIVIPVVAVLIFALLYITYGNVVDSVRVFAGVPFAAVGGVLALWLRDMPFSISAAIGFIAMSGVAVLDDMILVSCIRQLRRKGVGAEDAVQQAALTRLRPVLMTTLVASLGFLPMALSTGMGAEVQRPLATVVIGGVISAMVMTLLAGRVIYMLFDLGAGWLVSSCKELFEVRPDQLSWLVGEYREGTVAEEKS